MLPRQHGPRIQPWRAGLAMLEGLTLTTIRRKPHPGGSRSALESRVRDEKRAESVWKGNLEPSTRLVPDPRPERWMRIASFHPPSRELSVMGSLGRRGSGALLKGGQCQACTRAA